MQIFLALASLSLVAACGQGADRYAEAARETLSNAHSCPAERITVTPRPDLHAFDLMVGAPPSPPADIAADPGRLAEWQRRQRESQDHYNREKVYQAQGCDQVEYYACSFGTGTNDAQVMVCSQAKHPPG